MKLSFMLSSYSCHKTGKSEINNLLKSGLREYQMSKQIGNIKLYSVKDLHNALGINERTIRDWFNKKRFKGVKIGTEWHITEENLRRFLNAEEEGERKTELRTLKRKNQKR